MTDRAVRPPTTCIGAGSSDVQESVSQPVVYAKLRQPSAAPNPMGEERIGPAGKRLPSKGKSPQSPAVCAAAKRNHCGQANTENLKQCGERSRGTFKCKLAKKKGSAAIQFHPFPEN